MENGLESVVAAETVLSDVDGQRGRLIIRGHSLDDLVQRPDYEAVLALLFEGFFAELPKPGELGRLLGRARSEVFERLSGQLAAVRELPPIEAVRALMAQLSDGEDLATALQLVAAPCMNRGLENKLAVPHSSFTPVLA